MERLHGHKALFGKSYSSSRGPRWVGNDERLLEVGKGVGESIDRVNMTVKDRSCRRRLWRAGVKGGEAVGDRRMRSGEGGEEVETDSKSVEVDMNGG